MCSELRQGDVCGGGGGGGGGGERLPSMRERSSVSALPPDKRVRTAPARARPAPAGRQLVRARRTDCSQHVTVMLPMSVCSLSQRCLLR